MTNSADQSVADALQSVLADNTRRVYGAQWRLFTDWCDLVGLRSLPAEPLTVARYLAVRAGSGSTIATLRLATSADVLAVIRLTAPKPRRRGRGVETLARAAVRARFDLALVALLSDGGLRCGLPVLGWLQI